MVIFDTVDYIKKVMALLDDPSYKKLARAVCGMENCSPL
jgi:hypothetical protein